MLSLGEAHWGCRRLFPFPELWGSCGGSGMSPLTDTRVPPLTQTGDGAHEATRGAQVALPPPHIDGPGVFPPRKGQREPQHLPLPDPGRDARARTSKELPTGSIPSQEPGPGVGEDRVRGSPLVCLLPAWSSSSRPCPCHLVPGGIFALSVSPWARWPHGLGGSGSSPPAPQQVQPLTGSSVPSPWGQEGPPIPLREWP